MSLAQALALLSRCDLLDGPTPIQRLHRVEATLGSSLNSVELYAKRDDLMSLGGGGNKLRKLEFLLGEAMAAGAALNRRDLGVVSTNLEKIDGPYRRDEGVRDGP